MSVLSPPVPCACGETRVRREENFVLTADVAGKLKPEYSNTKFVCIGCGKGRFERRYVEGAPA